MTTWKIKRSGAGMTITTTHKTSVGIVEQKFTDIAEVEYLDHEHGGRIIATDSNGAQIELANNPARG